MKDLLNLSIPEKRTGKKQTFPIELITRMGQRQKSKNLVFKKCNVNRFTGDGIMVKSHAVTGIQCLVKNSLLLNQSENQSLYFLYCLS